LTADEERQASAFLAMLRKTPFAPPTNERVPARVFRHLLDREEIVRVSEEIAFAATAYEEMVARVRERLRVDGPLTLAEARDLLGTSRRYAQALLEHMDAKKITRREGDARVLG
jgi:selenocysteine-specific elongation factor